MDLTKLFRKNHHQMFQVPQLRGVGIFYIRDLQADIPEANLLATRILNMLAETNTTKMQTGILAMVFVIYELYKMAHSTEGDRKEWAEHFYNLLLGPKWAGLAPAKKEPPPECTAVMDQNGETNAPAVV